MKKLPRLTPTVSVTNLKDGTASLPFARVWADAMDAIERGPDTLSSAYVATPTAGTGYLEIKVNGVVYKLLAAT